MEVALWNLGLEATIFLGAEISTCSLMYFRCQTNKNDRCQISAGKHCLNSNGAILQFVQMQKDI